jgi:hypothetical protein
MANVRKPRGKDEGLHASSARLLASTDATKERLPSSAVQLTSEEREILEDPAWINEDEADTIIAMRIMRKEGHEAIPFEEYLRKRGVRLGR